MSNFTPLVTRHFQFGDDSVSVTFARLKRKHVLSILPFMGQLERAKNDGDSQSEYEATSEILTRLLDNLPEYVREVKGLNDADGEPISIGTIVEEMYFMELATDIAMALMDESTVVNGKQAKNL